MQDHLDYRRGLEAARTDAKGGWPRCWMPARQLAEEAVYCPAGLSAEQQGYAAGLDEFFPGGLGEIAGFLGLIQSPGPPLVVRPATWLEPVPALAVTQSVDALARVVPHWSYRPWGKGCLVPMSAVISVAAPKKDAEKKGVSGPVCVSIYARAGLLL